jgi:hypothetical protein
MKRFHHTVVALLWIFCVAITAQLLYAALGFNPTDDGFTLAYSRRILDGQVPHRDFVIIRPFLSPLLHVPETLLGGQYTYWLSRFVFFFQFACIAWFGTAFVNKSMGRPFSTLEQTAFAFISFTFCCHSFPPMAWHTIDGLFLCVLGLYIRDESFACSAVVGYFLIGAAYLCKQSFVFAAPGLLLILGDWRKWKCLLAAILPGIFYVAYLLLSGGLFDGLQQLLSQTGILQAGIQSYFINRFFLGLLAGLAVTGFWYGEYAEGRPCARKLYRAIELALIAVVFYFAIKDLLINGVCDSSFVVFGVVCGSLVYLILKGGLAQNNELKTGTTVALLAWSASLSLGYNYPALGSGILMTFLFALSYHHFTWTDLRRRSFVSLAFALMAISAFHYTRIHYIYREQPVSQLTCPLGDVLPGARLIRTNPNTYVFLADLNVAIRSVVNNGMKYAIIPDVAAHWVKAEQRNPLPVDWTQGTELSTAALTDRIVKSLDQQRSQQVVIVQKVKADELASGFVELKTEDRHYAVVTYVRTHFEKIGETRYFDLYK